VYDHAIVDNTYGIPSFGTKSLRISNAVTSGCFSDQTFSAATLDEAGETGALNGGLSGGTRQSHFDASFDLASVMATVQPGVYVSVSPDRGDGARMSYLRFEDQTDGIHVFFIDYTSPDFNETDIATLSRTPHRIRFSMDFINGVGNDVVKIYIDGVLTATGTSWEDYFRDWEDGSSRTVDSLLFRTGGDCPGDCVPGNAGNGFLFDNITTFSSPAALGTCPVSVTGTNPIEYTLLEDCVTDHTIHVPNVAALGTTFNGNGHSITGVDPTAAPLHFLGAVLQADAGGGPMTVKNLTVTVSNLADACDDGADRLRGILFDSVAGTIKDNTVTDVEQGAGGQSGCQEGNAIEVRNAPFSKGGSDKLVTISGNVTTDYQKTGIVANGSVNAKITGNVVKGDGPIGYIAQNGIQVGFGATANVMSNTASGNFYTGPDVACGLLLFDADGVKASKNNLFNNERNNCNFGKGGGNVTPSA
jgi:hypothetical protein